MLTFEKHCKNLMTLSRTGDSELTQDEYNELIALKDAITYSPSTVNSEKMEKFAELMVRSLDGKFDPPISKNYKSNLFIE